ncbi:MAG TPA: AI-2E family transporter [Gemmatimonadota bacterium]|jgi:predicted PurR-regulated permease PerM|nr:AI-2E family transporter [Gemmatimonadota bacterium]
MVQWRPFLMISWAILLGVFLWTVLPVLSPLILFLVLAYMLWPLFGTDTYKRLMLPLGALTFLWLLHVAGSVLAPFVLAFVLAYVTDPLVDWWASRGIGRTWGALGVLLLGLMVLALAVALIGPLVAAQGAQFLTDLPRILAELRAWYNAQVMGLANSQLPIIRDIPFERGLDVESRDVGQFLLDEIQRLNPSWEAAMGVGRGLQTGLTILGYLVLTPVLMFYLLRDFPSVGRGIAQILPPTRREGTLAFLHRYDVLLGEYLRGQLLVATFVGIATAIGFWIVGFPNAVLLGVIAGVFNIVPYLGLVVSLIPAALIALLTPPLWLSALKVAGVFFVVQSLDSYFFSPKIVGDRVGLHPVWVMLAIIGFASVFGLVGLLLAIPIAVLIKLVIEYMVGTYKASVYYRDMDVPLSAEGETKGEERAI